MSNPSDGDTGELEASMEDVMRDEVLDQLKRSLSESWRMMSIPSLDMKTKREWTKLHSYTATILNAVLRDRQNRDWENRLREVERLAGLTRRRRRIMWKGKGPEPYRPWLYLAPAGKPAEARKRSSSGRRPSRALRGRKR